MHERSTTFILYPRMTIDGTHYSVREIMRPAITLPHTSTLRDALALLTERGTNLAIVVADSGEYLGSVTTIDIIRAILPDYLEADTVAARFADDQMLREDTEKSANLPVADFLDRTEATIRDDAHLLEATVRASQDDTGRIVVLDADNKPVGVLTRTEIKKVLAAFLGITNGIA